MPTPSNQFYRQRAEQERAKAELASTEERRRAHLEMAAIFDERSRGKPKRE